MSLGARNHHLSFLSTKTLMNIMKTRKVLKSPPFTIISLTLLLCLNAAVVMPADVMLLWDPNTEGDLAGYGVYFIRDLQGPPFNLAGYVTLNELSDSNNPDFVVSGLAMDSDYYFAVTAYDTNNNESYYSSTICVHTGAQLTPCSPDSTGRIPNVTSSSSGGGGGCFISTLIR